ncbi:MAG TPA: carbon monoxide dehydrogenase subunit G [Alphaproteobacteria bacterium]|nr:carbon monoxide dehydrogenase subunit G [Alphaproteobacteria bacterium]
MDLTGDYRIGAAREAVWAALNDPAVLKACVPGCEELNKTSETEFAARVVVKIGPVKAGFGGKVTLSDIDPPNGYTITGEGQGGAAGFAKGGAKVSLESVENGAATILHYKVEAQIGGKLAQIGSRLVEGSARKLADEFFAAFAAEATKSAGAAVTPAQEATPAPTPGAAAPAAPLPTNAAAEHRQGLSPWVWIVGVTAVVVAVLAWVATRS